MCLPMTPAGPESEVMNPLLTVPAAAGETAATAARRPTRTARVIVRTGSLLLVRLAAVPREHGPGMSGAILADAPGESPGAPALAPALSARPARLRSCRSPTTDRRRAPSTRTCAGRR